MKDWKKEICTVPNFLSLFRLILIPVYIVLYLRAQTPGDYAVSAVVLAVSCLTDMIDGKIARRYGMVSNVGIVLDPVADKATQLSLLLCLALEYGVLWPLVGLFVVKESFQLLAGYLAYRKGKMMKGALLSGKICTTVLFVSLIVMVLLHEKITAKAVCIISIVDTVFMLISFVNYAVAYAHKTPMIKDI